MRVSDNELINNCYDNLFEIDLRAIHIEQSSFSAIHSEKGKPLTIKDIYFKDKTFIFEDGLSSQFKLVNISGLIYLLGDKSCYPCSRIYKNLLGRKWLNVLIIPENYKINCPGCFKESYLDYNALAIKVNNISKSYFKLFIECFNKCFLENDWYSTGWITRFIKEFNGFNLDQKVDYLRELHLLSPLELCITSFFYGYKLTSDDVYFCIAKKEVPIQILYLKPIPFKLDFKKSTLSLLNSQLLSKTLDGFSLNEIESFFEIEFLWNNLIFDHKNSEMIEDILGIDDIKRWISKKVGKPLLNHKTNKLKTYNIDEKFILSYYKRLRVNLRTLENNLRAEEGYKIVGSLYTESLIYTQLVKQLKGFKIISQYSPEWLGRQRFDMFIHELNIAIEYNGLQHYEPVTYFGGAEGFKNTRIRDETKRRKCKLNNCTLFEIRFDDNINESIEQIVKFVESKIDVNIKTLDKK